jgi:uncharacterized protein (TIGR03118 family)
LGRDFLSMPADFHIENDGGRTMQFRAIAKLLSVSLMLATLIAFSPFAAAQYQQTNLVSDITGLAPTTDAHLVNPWGLIAGPTTPFWIADNNGGVSTLYNGNNGTIVPLVVNIPPIVAGVGTGTPTGVVFSAGSGFTFLNGGVKTAAIFSFVTEDGTILAWPGKGDAVVVLDNSAIPTADNGAVYKGATIAKNGTASFLYVANFRSGHVEVYDTSFKQVTLNEDAFQVGEGSRGFAPFNVQEVNGDLYVTYAKQNASKHDDFDFPGLGFVAKFSTNGKLLQRLERGPWLNAPWGVALAPANFGTFSNHLLIGNAGSGQIAVYDAASGRFDGLLRDASGHAIQNDRLWALRFGNGATAGPANTLFFTAGIADERHGIFGTLTPAPGADNTPENDHDDR